MSISSSTFNYWGAMIFLMHPAANRAIASVGHARLGTACWDLQSGELSAFDELFLAFADLPWAEAVTTTSRPAWIDIFSGRDCIFLHDATRQHVFRSVSLVLEVEEEFRLATPAGGPWRMQPRMSFVTRLGRQKVLTFYVPIAREVRGKEKKKKK